MAQNPPKRPSSPIVGHHQVWQLNRSASYSHSVAGRKMNRRIPWRNLLHTNDDIELEEGVRTEVVKQITIIRGMAANDREAKLYNPVATILNLLSQSITSQKPKPTCDPIIFWVSPNKIVGADTFELVIKPDIVATHGSSANLKTYLRALTFDPDKPPKLPVPLHLPDCCSAVEAKSTEVLQGVHQESYYLEAIKQNSPHTQRVYGMAVNQEGYSLQEVTAGGHFVTEHKNWEDEDYKPLLAYVQAVYNSRYELDEHFRHSYQGLQIWRVTLEESETVTVLPIHSSPAPGRMTWVATGFVDTLADSIRVLKVYWVDSEKRDSEAKLYKAAHAKGHILGLANVVAHGNFNRKVVGPLTINGGDEITREKQWLMLDSTGEPLSQCDSAKEFLMVIYDILETLKAMVKSGVLHRDVSWYNVFCHPKYNNTPREDEAEAHYVEEILKMELPRCKCLIADLDQAISLSPNTENMSRRKERTGTAMFISVDFSVTERPGRPFIKAMTDIASLDEVLKGLTSIKHTDYIRKHLHSAKPIIQAYQAQTTIHLPTEIVHQPLHDVESVFWLMVFGLARANPVNSNVPPSEAYHEFCNHMLGHEIGGRDAFRKDMLGASAKEWRSILHPRLGGLADMITLMASYVSISWSRYDVELNTFPHDVLQAIVLHEIERMNEDPIELSKKNPRIGYLSHSAAANYRIRSSHRGMEALQPSESINSIQKEDDSMDLENFAWMDYSDRIPPENWRPELPKKEREETYAKIRQQLRNIYPNEMGVRSPGAGPDNRELQLVRARAAQNSVFRDEEWFKLIKRPDLIDVPPSEAEPRAADVRAKA